MHDCDVAIVGAGLAGLTAARELSGAGLDVRVLEARDRVGAHWWSTMRLAGREALHRSAVNLTRGTVPTMRELLLDLKVPRTYLLPEADGPLPGADALAEAGVAVVPIPETSEPAPGSEKPWHQISSAERMRGTKRRLCASEPRSISTGPIMPMPE